ncbi:MAG: molybdopterin molybdotransferase MoeA [Chloroflexi bacterium]|nr:molybdopterin molybdotransferase MoeA [Chloroflexota bacterium]MCI0579358.1 molybdopterin molybdotransferase MoeA [Chloroflexota bacterium]MCI0646009.1 molybdopterin molybdotransferase MoeA [Chloroflexota bacterium]MCI0727431.1 molybdopterin molybdotransferase MoeA [Chloroflexota bacterium]
MADAEYLTVAEALQAVLAGVSVLPAESIPLLPALGRVLAGPVVAQDSLPPFANSSMDGYALRAADLVGASRERPATLRVVADIAAGAVWEAHLGEGTAARIMTGAPLPAGADAVVPVEETNEPWRDPERPLPGQIEVYRPVNPGDYVRWPGEDIQADEVVLPAGHVLRPQEIGVLAALGVAQVQVVRRPRVGILATGDELIGVEEPLRPGKIRNSNGYAQAAQVLAMGAELVALGVAGDTEADVRAKLQRGLEAGVDLFVSSAGVSVGAYDVVKAVLEQEGNVTFWRVRMRPGKPLAYGRYGGVPYLGLPGNPVSAMVSFERFARPAIRKMAGHTTLERPQVQVVMQEEIRSDGRESYLRAIVTRGPAGYQATTTGGQGSHIMTSLVKANALVIVPEGVTVVAAGERLAAMMIDWPETVF